MVKGEDEVLGRLASVRVRFTFRVRYMERIGLHLELQFGFHDRVRVNCGLGLW